MHTTIVVGAFVYEKLDDVNFMRRMGCLDDGMDTTVPVRRNADFYDVGYGDVGYGLGFDFESMLEGLDDDDEINDDEEFEDELFERADEVDPLDAEHLPFTVGVRKSAKLRKDWCRLLNGVRRVKHGKSDRRRCRRLWHLRWAAR